MANTDQSKRVARQHLQSLQLMGVDFVPVGHGQTADHQNEADDPDPQRSITPTATSKSLFAAQIEPKVDSRADRAAALEALRTRHDAECTLCTQVEHITQTVFGEGDPNASLMFVGEAPGEEEDRTGRPFVGRAGKKLDDIIRAMGLQREQVFIANILKSRPPGNRTPLEHEVEACAPFLREQIRIITPRVLVALGGPAAKWMLQTLIGITRLRGSWAIYADPDTGQTIPVMPTFHPAFLLRQYTRENREKVWSDMQAVMKKLAE